MLTHIINSYKFKQFVYKHFYKFQIGADGRRSQIYLALSTAAEFRDHLSSFSDYYASLGIYSFKK